MISIIISASHSLGPPYICCLFQKVVEPVATVVLEELNIYLLEDVTKARRRTPGHAPGNKNDPAGYQVFKVCEAFLDNVFAGKDGGGDTKTDAEVRSTYVC